MAGLLFEQQGSSRGGALVCAGYVVVICPALAERVCPVGETGLPPGSWREFWVASPIKTTGLTQRAAMTVRDRLGSAPHHLIAYSLVELNSRLRAQASSFSAS
jgi:hypothetical protein